MVSCEINIRNEFFISVLFLENMITSYFSEKLRMGGIVNTDVLEDDVKSINFEQKIGILLESDKFSIIDKSKLSVFREIYKELNFNKNADTFENCLTSTDSNDDFLLILYPQEDVITREEKLTNACILLIDDVTQLVSNYTNKIEVKLFNRLFNINASVIRTIALVFSILLFK
jgi:hypothetical protein